MIGCKSINRVGLTFHRFPKNSFLREKWLEICGRPITDIGKDLRVCQEHFEEDSYREGKTFTPEGNKRKYLLPNAVPTINVNLNIEVCKKESKTKGEQFMSFFIHENFIMK